VRESSVVRISKPNLEMRDIAHERLLECEPPTQPIVSTGSPGMRKPPKPGRSHRRLTTLL
jgi:hypothetical protein